LIYIWEGIKEAVRLILSADTEIMSILWRSLVVSGLSTLLGTVIAVPVGVGLGLAHFRAKKHVGHLLHAMMGLPPVVVGLTVALALSRRGPLGSLSLLFSIEAMVIAQTLLITPIILGIIFQAVSEHGQEVKDVAVTLGAIRRQRLFLMIREFKKSIGIAVTTGFGRAISEVGAVMIVGGNIQHHTRVMTTYIAMHQSMGEYERAIAMGLILLILSLVINVLIHIRLGDTR